MDKQDIKNTIMPEKNVVQEQIEAWKKGSTVINVN